MYKQCVSTMPKIGITLDSVDPERQTHLANYSVENWYGLRYRYAEAIVSKGGVPYPLPHYLTCVNEFADTLDGLLITGGGFDVDPVLYGQETVHPSVFLKPSRTEFEVALCKAFFERKKPIFGICGGMQLINVIFGGTLYQHLPDVIDEEMPNLFNHSAEGGGKTIAHPIRICPNTNLAALRPYISTIQVNSVHHQAVHKLGQGLRPTAICEDGIIEGFEMSEYPSFLHGIQWHPEFLMNELDHALFHSFINQAAGK